MSSVKSLKCLAVGFVLICAVDAVRAQPTFERTIIVDRNGTPDANYDNIQDAITLGVPTSPDEKWTILIYAGVYDLSDPNAPVVLGATKGNVDLVGVDPDAVIIKAPSDDNAIEIQGRGARNNSIRNLTIVLDDASNAQTGILIDKVGTGDDPSNIEIVDVTFKLDESNGTAIALAASDSAEDITIRGVSIKSVKATGTILDLGSTQNVTINNLTLEAQDGYGIKVGDQTTIRDSSIVVKDGVGTGGDHADAALFADGKDDLTIVNCTLQGRLNGIHLAGACNNVLVANCAILGTNEAVHLECVDEAVFKSCRIRADSTLGDGGGNAGYHGVYVTNASGCEPGVIRFESCVIDAISKNDNDDAQGVTVMQAPASADGPVQFADCAITSTASGSGEKSFGVVGEEAEAVALIGGSVTSSDSDEREADQFDLSNDASSGLGIRVADTSFSKWKGAIGPAVKARSVVQRTVSVGAASDTAVLAATALTGSEQEITSGITDPDVYRVLKAKRNHTSGSQDVIIIGTDFGGAQIADKITIADTESEQDGVKPFKTVTKIILPGRSDIGQQVSVGTTDKLGLRFPISAGTDVQQQGKKTTASTSYVIGSVGTVNVTYATVDVSTITTGDSFEWSVLASE